MCASRWCWQVHLNWTGKQSPLVLQQFSFHFLTEIQTRKKKCAAKHRFSKNSPFHAKPALSFRGESLEGSRQTSPLSTFMIVINMMSSTNIAPSSYQSWREALQRLYKMPRPLLMSKINIFMSQYLLLINVSEIILPSRGATRRSLLIGIWFTLYQQ